MTATLRRGLRIDDPLAALPSAEHDHPDHAQPSAGPWTAEGRLRELPLEQIRANPNQPRKRVDTDALEALAGSIRERGILQPVIVRPVEDRFELVAGERRWRAAQLAGKTTIPALVDGGIDATGSLELALIENVVREDLTAIEQARTLSLLLEDLGVTGAVLARRLGRSRADLANTVRLLELPDEAIEMIDAGQLTKGHGKALLTEPDHHRRRELARRAAQSGWSVRTLEAEITRTPKTPQQPDADHLAAAERLQDAIGDATGCDVRARPHRHGFQIIVDQAGAEHLMQLLATRDQAQ